MTEYRVRTRPGATTVRVSRPGGVTRVRTRLAESTGTGSTGDIAAAIANGAVVLAVYNVDLPAEDFGGVFDGDELTVAAAAGSAPGTWILTNQTNPSNNDLWTHDGSGTFTRQDPGLALSRLGTYVASENTLIDAINAQARPQFFRVTGANEVTELRLGGGALIAEYLVAVDAIDGSATTFQPIKRADDAVADGIIPANYLARGAPLNVSDWVGVYVVVPTPDITGDPSEYGRVYRISPYGDPWIEVPLGTNDPLLVVGGSDVGLPEWWVNRDSGPRPVHVAAHNVRLSRDSTVNTPDTIKPWGDLNEAVIVLARAIEWTFSGKNADWAFVAGLDQPSIWYTVDNAVAVPVTGTLPPLNDFPVGRTVRVTSFTAQPVSIVTDEDATLVATLGELDSYEFTHNGTNWVVVQHADGAPTSTVDVVSNVTGPSLLGRASGAGDSEELTAAQVQEMLGVPGVVLHRETLAMDAAVKSYDVTGWAKIRVEVTGRGTRNATILGLLATLNGDTGNVYSTNAAALTSALTLGNLPGSSTNTNRRGMVNAEIDLTEGDYKEGLAWATNVGSTATVGQAPANVGLWSTITAEVTSIELKMQLDNIAAGARIRIIGLEAA